MKILQLVPNNFLSPSLEYLSTKIRVRFSGSCLKQNAITYIYEKSANIYIFNEINKNDHSTISDPALENCLFGAVTLTKNADMGILVMELDLIGNRAFRFQVVDSVKM